MVEAALDENGSSLDDFLAFVDDAVGRGRADEDQRHREGDAHQDRTHQQLEGGGGGGGGGGKRIKDSTQYTYVRKKLIRKR